MEDQGWQALQESVTEKTKNCLVLPQVISTKKEPKKSIFFGIKKTFKKGKVNFFTYLW
jgi:hypothetical protein